MLTKSENTLTFFQPNHVLVIIIYSIYIYIYIYIYIFIFHKFNDYI